jgi:hypothetical protein
MRRLTKGPGQAVAKNEKALKGGNRDEAGANEMIWRRKANCKRVARTLDVMS